MRYPQAIQNLIDQLSQLPSVGPKTAERYVFYLLKKNPEDLQKLAQAIAELKEKIIICSSCLAMAEANPCSICFDLKRDRASLCIVADSRDLSAIEATGQYQGLYFVLGGVLNAIEGMAAEQLNIKQLLQKIKQDHIKEIILALNPDLEGETTAMYLVKLLKPFKINPHTSEPNSDNSGVGIKITRLAKGLPMGADLEYADEITLTNALKYRNEI